MTRSVTCQTCVRSFSREYGFSLFYNLAKINPADYVDPIGPVHLCRWHGMEEFLKGKESVYFFSPYFKAKARKYLRRWGKERLKIELERASGMREYVWKSGVGLVEVIKGKLEAKDVQSS